MNTNTSEVLTKGMESLLARMSIVDVEQFIFLIKAEGFDYTKWQRDYFGNISKEELLYIPLRLPQLHGIFATPCR